MDDPLDEERAARIRAARQVLAGNEIEPPDDLFRIGDRAGGLRPAQYVYLAALVGLLVVGLLVWAVVGLTAASVVFFLLSLLLLIAWALLSLR